MKYQMLALTLLIPGCSAPQNTPISQAGSATATLETPAAPIVTNSVDDAATGAMATADLAAATRSAVQSALPFLESEGTAWMEGRVPVQEGAPCVSCHHVGYAIWSHEEARRAGIETLAPRFEALSESAIEFLGRPDVPRALNVGQVMFAQPDQAAGLRDGLIELQKAAGYWRARGQFPTQRRPIAETDAIATMYALLALQETNDEGTLSDAHGKALRWLDEQPQGRSTEWLAWRLVLAHALEAGDQIPTLSRTLLDRQRDDGGWGWAADDPSDAFSTGQALYALSLVAAPSGATERAARFLVESQGDDGSWHTPSALVSVEPSEEKDVIYHFWGTAWATLGLSRSLDVPAIASSNEAGTADVTHGQS